MSNKMSNLSNQRRLASQILDCGLDRVWLNPEATEEIASAITREDIRGLVEEGSIKARPVKGVSRGRARLVAAKRKYGHRKGQGSRRGKKGARTSKKEQWLKGHLKNPCIADSTGRQKVESTEVLLTLSPILSQKNC